MIKQYTIKSKDKKKAYSVTLSFFNKIIIPEKSSCTCKWGSFYRFTKRNIALGKWKCKHIEIALKKYKNKELDDIEKSKREENNGKKRNRKPIYSIF